MANCEDLRDIETKTKQDNGILEQFFRTKGQPSIQLFIGRGERDVGAWPMKMAKTGAPITGKNPPKYQDTIEMRRQAKMPAPFFDRNDIKTSK